MTKKEKEKFGLKVTKKVMKMMSETAITYREAVIISLQTAECITRYVLQTACDGYKHNSRKCKKEIAAIFTEFANRKPSDKDWWLENDEEQQP